MAGEVNLLRKKHINKETKFKESLSEKDMLASCVTKEKIPLALLKLQSCSCEFLHIKPRTHGEWVIEVGEN